MSDLAIEVEKLSKLYRINAIKRRHDTLRDQLTGSLQRLLRRNGHLHAEQDTFWALRDVSFEVRSGEIIGIIGRNGAGKSTLLKILSRITEPTSGRARIYGRVASLLEVGTGFHAELTGRENVYLNGAILGMSRAEINRKFDEIVSFSGVERFIDTPVKHYSSGMKVRLAFSVAAHLEPEILLVDEVLSVGDAAFQKKCLWKMGDVVKAGRTVLFVSHNMGAVETLCSRGVLLEEGMVSFSGSIRQTVSNYLAQNYRNNGNPFAHCSRSGNGFIKITSFHVESLYNEKTEIVKSGDSVVFVIGFEKVEKVVSKVSIGVSLQAENETNLFHNYSHFTGIYFDNLPESGYFKCLIHELPVTPGNYLVGLRILEGGNEADWPKVLIPITVINGDFYKTSTVETQHAGWGYFMVKCEWELLNGKEKSNS